ncbi:hypothetical protein PACTADRAFT_17503 [Pachysolen tannophilus NRRL Y-2460]|uniref:Histone-lysine N-methyltransferase n=1 Tax=Pachysolen tannophilus NRRL Y-2460 TaxID=669874 RepID=A0A1E4TSU0_PACTA|nr:hypothetical protein PACTADRAFT_17503 [Pachysolen tannophilus NRRL Y-2460]
MASSRHSNDDNDNDNDKKKSCGTSKSSSSKLKSKSKSKSSSSTQRSPRLLKNSCRSSQSKNNQIRKNALPKKVKKQNEIKIKSTCKENDSNIKFNETGFFDKDMKPVKLWLLAGLYSKPVQFKIPYNIFCPSNGNYKVVKWKPLKKNIWLNPDQRSKLLKQIKQCKDDNVKCDCQGRKCEENCFNKILQIECDQNVCGTGNDDNYDCGNRNFTNALKKNSLNSSYAKGVEVVNAGNKGNGLRAIREYKPHSFIVEYTGEVMDQNEVERRLNDLYHGGAKNHFFFLNLEKGFSIDSGIKGSVARFVNHSCEPNAEMQKWIVHGEPRVGLFAGPKGIQAGDEITYHYNFEWFPDAVPQPCYCGSSKCSGFIGKRSDLANSYQNSPSSSVELTPEPPKSKRKLNNDTSACKISSKKYKRNIKNNENSLPIISSSIRTKKLSSQDPADSKADFKAESKENYASRKLLGKSTVNDKTTTDLNPYDIPLSQKTTRNRRRHENNRDFLEITASMPPHIAKLLSINMAPPGSQIDVVSEVLAKLAADSVSKPESCSTSRPRTRGAQSTAAITAGIPLRYLKASGKNKEENIERSLEDESTVKRDQKRSLPNVESDLKLTKTKRKTITKPKSSKENNGRVVKEKLDQEFEKMIKSTSNSKISKLLTSLSIDDKIPKVLAKGEKRLSRVSNTDDVASVKKTVKSKLNNRKNFSLKKQKNVKAALLKVKDKHDKEEEKEEEEVENEKLLPVTFDSEISKNADEKKHETESVSATRQVYVKFFDHDTYPTENGSRSHNTEDESSYRKCINYPTEEFKTMESHRFVTTEQNAIPPVPEVKIPFQALVANFKAETLHRNEITLDSLQAADNGIDEKSTVVTTQVSHVER